MPSLGPYYSNFFSYQCKTGAQLLKPGFNPSPSPTLPLLSLQIRCCGPPMFLKYSSPCKPVQKNDGSSPDSESRRAVGSQTKKFNGLELGFKSNNVGLFLTKNLMFFSTLFRPFGFLTSFGLENIQPWWLGKIIRPLSHSADCGFDCSVDRIPSLVQKLKNFVANSLYSRTPANGYDKLKLDSW